MSEMVQAANKFRAQMLAQERQAANALVQSYGQAWQRMKRDLDQLAGQIAQARKDGVDVSRAWLLQQDRLPSLLSQTELQLGHFARNADASIQAQQRQAIAAAGQHAQELTLLGLGSATGAAQIAAQWNRLPDPAISQLIGHLSDGSPLSSLLDQLGPDASAAIRKALITGVALGKRPRDIALDVQNEAGMRLTRSLAIARTETLRAYRSASLLSYQANADVVEGWIWLASLSSRTCFPKGTMIVTRHGELPIESVVIGDEVLTHQGKYRVVTERMRREYKGIYYTIEAGEHTVTATAEHPFLAEREGKLQWIEARALRLGDTVFCHPKRGDDEVNHGLTDFPIERGIRQPQNAAACGLNGECLASVLRFSSRRIMPVDSINLQSQAKFGQEEVGRITPTGKDVFLQVGDANSLKAEPRIALRFRFSGVTAIAPDAAELIGSLCTGLNTKLFAAGEAGIGERRSAANLRTVMPIRIACAKDFATSLARKIKGFAQTASGRTKSAFFITRVAGEFFSAFCTLFDRASSIRTALPGAVFLFCLPGRDLEFKFATFAQFGLLRNSDGPAPRVRMGLLQQRIAGSRAVFPAPSLYPRRRAIEEDAALLASSFHAHIIAHISTHVKVDMVYNLEVEDHHTYVANGFVVHNCAACLAMNGTFHANEEEFASHPCCRCSPAPQTKTWADLGIEGDDDVEETRPAIETGTAWLARQDDATQTAVLGRAGREAYAKGTVSLSDFVGVRHSEKWGDSVYARSLKDALQAAALPPGGQSPPAPNVAPSPPTPPLMATAADARQAS